MRLITYILGAIAGFFTFGGIGLIIKGYQVEGGITLVIGLLTFPPTGDNEMYVSSLSVATDSNLGSIHVCEYNFDGFLPFSPKNSKMPFF